jgi:hypothetical protein
MLRVPKRIPKDLLFEAQKAKEQEEKAKKASRWVGGRIFKNSPTFLMITRLWANGGGVSTKIYQEIGKDTNCEKCLLKFKHATGNLSNFYSLILIQRKSINNFERMLTSI